jgi:DNA end-binding protein Ku
MRPLWKGAINFGLVNIPVSLYSATQSKQKVDLDMLRDSDHSRIRYKRVAEADGKEVPWEHIVKGYEYEKGEYVVLEPEDFKRVQLKSNQMVEIKEFVNLDDIDTRYFDEPYFLAPERQGAKAYSLLHDALVESGKVGVAKVVIRPPREHLAAVRPLDGMLMLELLHFADELRDPKELDIPKAETGKKEMDMALTLVKSMAGKWQPDKYKDEYREALMNLIEEKIKAGGKKLAPAKVGEKPTPVIDLVSILQQSIAKAAEGPTRKKPAAKSRARHHRKAA